MFRDIIKGLDQIIQGDIPRGSIILVTGTEGTLKSSLVFSMISRSFEKKTIWPLCNPRAGQRESPEKYGELGDNKE